MGCAYFVSDLHLACADDTKTRVFIRFLEQLFAASVTKSQEAPEHLFLVGDVFDLWIGGHSYFRQRFHEVISAVTKLVDCGVQVHFFEGNHDLHLKSYWQNELGVKVHSDAEYFQLGPCRVRVEHGDLINPNDRGYLFLRAFLRSSPMRALALGLPSSVVKIIGETASRASRKHTSTSKRLSTEEIRFLIRSHAERALAEEPYDLMVSGHVHVVDDQMIEISGRRGRSVNLGSWFDGARAFVLSETKAHFIELRDGITG
jgi:UDP-2,3-diacylglucosamine hydrolase